MEMPEFCRLDDVLPLQFGKARTERERKMEKTLLYIHGRGGNAAEAAQFAPFCPGYTLSGVDYEEAMPWDVVPKLEAAYDAQLQKGCPVGIIANSIGAYFVMLALQDRPVNKALFISPVLDMEALIMRMMGWAAVQEEELRTKKEIETDFGQPLSWEYLQFARNNPLHWTAPTEILYAQNDTLVAWETVDRFVRNHDARLTVMEGGEHWFHTGEQMDFLGRWMRGVLEKNGK